jgi:hypothetical protein
MAPTRLGSLAIREKKEKKRRTKKKLRRPAARGVDRRCVVLPRS